MAEPRVLFESDEVRIVDASPELIAYDHGRGIPYSVTMASPLRALLAALDEERAKVERYEAALHGHLCEYDAADWLACNPGSHGDQHCEVCAEADDGQHRHALLVRAETAEAKVERLRSGIEDCVAIAEEGDNPLDWLRELLLCNPARAADTGGHHKPTVHRDRTPDSRPGDTVWTDCPECGPDAAIDEDGRCSTCGADALHYGGSGDTVGDTEGRT